MSPADSIHLADLIAALERPGKEAAQKTGKSADGTAGGRGKKKNLPGISRKVSPSPETRDVAAAATGEDLADMVNPKAIAPAAPA